MSRYLVASDNNTKRAMTRYRNNLHLSQELFTTISCFEIALRNAIDRFYSKELGQDWLRQAAAQGGIFDIEKCKLTADNINDAIRKLNKHYAHHKLVAELGFGF